MAVAMRPIPLNNRDRCVSSIVRIRSVVSFGALIGPDCAAMQAQADRIMSAALSAIMMVGALVLPADQVRHDRGINHPQPLHADDLQRGIGDRIRIPAHAAGAYRMVDRVGAGADGVEKSSSEVERRG